MSLGTSSSSGSMLKVIAGEAIKAMELSLPIYMFSELVISDEIAFGFP